MGKPNLHQVHKPAYMYVPKQKSRYEITIAFQIVVGTINFLELSSQKVIRVHDNDLDALE